MEANLINDVSVLTDVSENTLKKFINVTNFCIGHSVYESIVKQQNVTELDVGFGELHIKVEGDAIRYRFIPSKELEKVVLEAVTHNTSPIMCKLDSNLQDRINRAYKEMI